MLHGGCYVVSVRTVLSLSGVSQIAGMNNGQQTAAGDQDMLGAFTQLHQQMEQMETQKQSLAWELGVARQQRDEHEALAEQMGSQLDYLRIQLETAQVRLTAIALCQWALGSALNSNHSYHTYP